MSISSGNSHVFLFERLYTLIYVCNNVFEQMRMYVLASKIDSQRNNQSHLQLNPNVNNRLHVYFSRPFIVFKNPMKEINVYIYICNIAEQLWLICRQYCILTMVVLKISPKGYPYLQDKVLHFMTKRTNFFSISVSISSTAVTTICCGHLQFNQRV